MPNFEKTFEKTHHMDVARSFKFLTHLGYKLEFTCKFLLVTRVSFASSNLIFKINKKNAMKLQKTDLKHKF